MQVEAGIGELCELFGMSRQAWYEHQKREKAVLLDECIIVEAVRATRSLHEGLEKISGKAFYVIVKDELIRNGVKIGRDKFLAVFMDYGLNYIRKRFKPHTTNSKGTLPCYPNLAAGMEITAPEQLWVSDITYLWVGKQFHYLSLITDAYSHRIMGHYLSENLRTEGCLISLRMALSNRMYPQTYLTHHSDRGLQYRSDIYKTTLGDNTRLSMSPTADPYANAIAERINGILKVDMGLADRVFYNRSEAIRALDAVIKTYNEIRPHMSIDYLVPAKAHLMSGPIKSRWKTNRKEVHETALP